MVKVNLFDKYSAWIRNASMPEDISSIMECVEDDVYNGALSKEAAVQLMELAENITAALLNERECV